MESECGSIAVNQREEEGGAFLKLWSVLMVKAVIRPGSFVFADERDELWTGSFGVVDPLQWSLWKKACSKNGFSKPVIKMELPRLENARNFAQDYRHSSSKWNHHSPLFVRSLCNCLCIFQSRLSSLCTATKWDYLHSTSLFSTGLRRKENPTLRDSLFSLFRSPRNWGQIGKVFFPSCNLHHELRFTHLLVFAYNAKVCWKMHFL